MAYQFPRTVYGRQSAWTGRKAAWTRVRWQQRQAGMGGSWFPTPPSTLPHRIPAPPRTHPQPPAGTCRFWRVYLWLRTFMVVLNMAGRQTRFCHITRRDVANSADAHPTSLPYQEDIYPRRWVHGVTRRAGCARSTRVGLRASTPSTAYRYVAVGRRRRAQNLDTRKCGTSATATISACAGGRGSRPLWHRLTLEKYMVT